VARPDGDFAFVEGEKTGLPMNELSVTVPTQGNNPKPPPVNPFFAQPDAPPALAKGMRDFPLYTTTHKGGLYVPERMSQKDFDLLKTQIQNSLAIIHATAVEPNQPSGSAVNLVSSPTTLSADMGGIPGKYE
jgi:hypothetical protein